MTFNVHAVSLSGKMVSVGILLAAVTSVFGQVSPAEVLSPRSRDAEQRYLPQLQSLHQSIDSAKLSFPFKLARYLHAKPGQRAALDSNGIEFVEFQHRVVLKISGAFSAAFNSAQLSRNERASRTFQEAVVPILRLVAQQIPKSTDYDAIGFEIIYDVRDADKSYDLVGKEVLSVVLAREDAFKYSNTLSILERQQLLNRSGVFVNGEEFGLALGQRDPLEVEALERSANPDAGQESSSTASTAVQVQAISGAVVAPAVSVTQPAPESEPAPSFADAMRLQTQFQPQLNAILREGGRRFHLTEGTAPSFEISGDQTVLHFTLQNTLSFERTTTSIYKRAAQSFDLFLAPELRDFSRQLPVDEGYDTIEFSVINQFGVGRTSPETIDYICPRKSLRAFVGNKITSQDLISQSIVLVNGVRIALNLQLVE